MDLIQEVAESPDHVRLFGIRIDNVTLDRAVGAIMDRVHDRNGPSQVCFVNAHCINVAHRDKEYLDLLRNADLVFADGIGMKLAGILLNREIRQNVNGTDLFPRLCAELSGTRVFLLGSVPGVAEGVRQWMRENFPEVRVRGCHQGHLSAGDADRVEGRIRDSGADVLIVAMGVPRQEKWIQRHLRGTGVKVAIGVGGLFDFYSGRIPRAPLWMRRNGLEWIHRFGEEPRRMWKRYLLGNPLFLLRAWKERMRERSNGAPFQGNESGKSA